MRVIICGAGQVGYNIAAYLSREDNDVTVIDVDPLAIAKVNEDLDVNGVVGHASNPAVLMGGGASDADMIIAVTESDEVNMVACQVTHSLFNIPKKIARIRRQDYLDPAWSNLFSRAHMPIDVIISPEIIVAEDINRRLSIPGTTSVVRVANGLAHVIGVICEENCPVLHTPLDQIALLFPDLDFKIVAIIRNNKPVVLESSEQILPDDEVYFVANTEHVKRVMAAFGHEEQEARRIVIAGGGNIGLGLAKMLIETNPGLQIKIIERDRKRAEYLSGQLPETIILNGDGLVKEIMVEAGIENVETYVAVTNDDESNIIGSLLAKQHGCGRAITLVNNTSYSSLVGALGVDAMVSPRSTVVATIMQHVRRGRIKGLHSLRDGFAEIIEAEVSDTSSIVNKLIKELELPFGVTLGAILRDDKIVMPKSEVTIRAGDHLIVLASQGQAPEVEKMFSVQVDLF